MEINLHVMFLLIPAIVELIHCTRSLSRRRGIKKHERKTEFMLFWKSTKSMTNDNYVSKEIGLPRNVQIVARCMLFHCPLSAFLYVIFSSKIKSSQCLYILWLFLWIKEKKNVGFLFKIGSYTTLSIYVITINFKMMYFP